MQNKNRNPLAKASEGNKDSFRSINKEDKASLAINLHPSI